MIKKIADRIVDYQIKISMIKSEEKRIYQYGYIILLEYCINIVAAALIAVVFKAHWIMLAYTVSYILLRSYAGGYHAKTSLGCFCMSVCVLILAIGIIRGISDWKMVEILFATEVFMIPYVFMRIPIPIENKPMNDNEKRHFGRRTRILYLLETVVEIALLAVGWRQSALAILLAHVTILVLVIRDDICKLIEGKSNKA